MKITEFMGGTDIQRSLNHSDSRCVNLIPALNDKGDIAAFYGAPGLTLEVTNPSSAVGSGIYTASNGRCFEVAGTTLYELIDTAGVISTTSRGTVTVGNPIYRMIDNGIEMILVNGTDGWLFTFATNTLKKIKVATADFTVTIANPAVFTKTAHGLVAGDAIRLTSTTGSILSDSILEALVPASVSSISTPFDAVVSPLNDFAYVTHNVYGGTFPYKISMYSIGGDGKLSPLSPPSIALTSGLHYAQGIILSSDGISAYAACTEVGTTWYPVIDTFSVNTTTGQLTNQGRVIAGNAVTPGAISPTGITISADDAFVYSSDFAANEIRQYSRNLGTGTLTPLTPAVFACAGGPQEIAISDDGLFAYVSCKTSNIIRIFARNAVTGLLSAASPASVSCEGISPTGLALSPDTNNPFLYVINNGSNEIEVFSRNSSTGAITHVASSSIATGTSPQKIIVTAESVYVTNSGSNTVSMFIRNTSTGLLTATSTPTIATESAPIGIAIAPDGNSVYVCNSGSSSISQYSRNATADYVGLPTGLQELTTYYVISAGLTADNFEVSETEGGTAVATSGQQAGVHTYTTLGYGFPEGAKTVSYMNGRFVALEPNTQNFYVSEVLDGKWWDALNVQTVDSNPDYVIGETVSHNELIVFCQDSGEVFYDIGETPSPFVRNTSGIFEVGCVAPYSICNLDNQVFWLGGTKNGAGIVYKLQGFTPMRISTHSIEYAIQSMTDITDARAFSYQRDGHHYYVLSFPTGDKTFSYDVNTGMWVELADWNGSAYSRFPAQECAYFAGKHLALGISGGYVFSIDPTVYKYGSNDIKWLRSFKVPTANMNKERHTRLQLDCEVGNGTVISGGSVDSVTMTNNGTSVMISTLAALSPETIATGTKPMSCALTPNGSFFYVGNEFTQGNATISMYSRNSTTGDLTALSPASIAAGSDPWDMAISPDGLHLYCINNYGDVVRMYSINASTGQLTALASPTIATGTNPTGVAISPDGLHVYSCCGSVLAQYINMYSRNSSTGALTALGTPTVSAGSSNKKLAVSPDGLHVYCADGGNNRIYMYSRNSSTGILTALTPAYVSANSGLVDVCISDDGLNVYASTASAVYMYSRSSSTGLLSALSPATIAINGASSARIEIADDGGSVYVSNVDTLSMYKRDTSTGLLTALSPATIASGTTAQGISISSDGEHVYSIASSSNIAYMFSRDNTYTGGTYSLTFTGGGGSAAAGTYTISATTGQITGTSITNAGSGYTSAPTVGFPSGGISGAAGTAVMTYVYTSPTVTLKWSDDGARTFNTGLTQTTGGLGEYSKRVVWHRLGITKGQPRVYELSSTDPVKTTLLNVHLD